MTRFVHCLVLSLFTLTVPSAIASRWSPFDYGAVANGKTPDTAALQRTIDAAHAAGGGTVRLSPGRYLTGTLALRSGVTLHLEKGAVLLGSARVADYRRGKWPALLLAEGQERIAVTGEGEIDGQGAAVAADTIRIFESGRLVEFFPGVTPGQTVRLGADTTADRVIDPHALQAAGALAAVVAPRDRADRATWRVDECVRPQLIEFSHCRGVRVSGVTLRNAANWVQSYRMCDDLEIRGVTVRSTTYWNNDGIDVVNCRRVRIEDCDIDSADDGICLKSEPNAAGRGCEDIAIARCRVRSSASAVKLGTASHHAFRRIRIEDLDVRDTFRSAVALETVDGAALEDVEVRRVRARRTGNAFFIRLGQRNLAQPPGVLRRVLLENFEVDVPAGKPDAGYPHEGPPASAPMNLAPASIVGLPDRPIDGVELRNIRITYGGGASAKRSEAPPARVSDVPENRAGYPEFTMFGELPAWGLFIRDAQNVALQNVTLSLARPDSRSALVAVRTEHLVLDALNCQGVGHDAPTVLITPTVQQPESK